MTICSISFANSLSLPGGFSFCDGHMSPTPSINCHHDVRGRVELHQIFRVFESGAHEVGEEGGRPRSPCRPILHRMAWETKMLTRRKMFKLLIDLSRCMKDKLRWLGNCGNLFMRPNLEPSPLPGAPTRPPPESMHRSLHQTLSWGNWKPGQHSECEHFGRGSEQAGML